MSVLYLYVFLQIAAASHLSLLAFNALSIRILSGDYDSKNSKGIGTAVLLVASQVLLVLIKLLPLTTELWCFCFRAYRKHYL